MAIVLIFPIGVLILIYSNLDQLGTHNFDKKFSSLYEGLRLNSKAALFLNVIFLLRRLIFAIISVTLRLVPVA